MSAFEQAKETVEEVSEITTGVAQVVVDQEAMEKEMAKQKKREEIIARVAAMKAAMEAEAVATALASAAAQAADAPVSEAKVEADVDAVPAAAVTKQDKNAIKKKNKEKAMLYKAMFMESAEETGLGEGDYAPAPEIFDKVRVGHTKGKTGVSDFTKGKCAFVRPCTVGWKSQNQPVQRAAGNRTPL